MGHFALGYLAGKASSRYLKVKVKLPLLLAMSILLDLDIVFRLARA